MTDTSAKWYVVNGYGDAEACESAEAAAEVLEILNRYAKHNCPYRAVQMVEADELTHLRGEAAVMRELLRRCNAVLLTIEPESAAEHEAIGELSDAVERAIGDGKGTLL